MTKAEKYLTADTGNSTKFARENYKLHLLMLELHFSKDALRLIYLPAIFFNYDSFNQ
jgi:hypothetical protein